MLDLVAVYTALFIIASVVVVASAVLVIRKVVIWRTTRADSRLDDFFTERFSSILALRNVPTVDSVKASFFAMLRRSDIIGKYSRRKKKESARRVLCRMAVWLSGESRVFLERLYDELGFANQGIGELASRRWWKRADAVRELTLMHVSRAAGPIAGLLSDPRDEVKLASFESLIELKGIDSLRTLARQLGDVTPWKAINFARVISRHEREAAPAVEVLLGHADISVRLFAIRMLGVVRSITSVPVLIRIAGTSTPPEVREALVALGRIGDERAVNVCRSCLASPHAGVRIAAAGALGAFGNPSLSDILVPLLEDNVSDVRLSAAQALSQCGEEGRSVLEVACTTGDKNASTAARHVLDDMALLSVTPIVAQVY